MMKMKRIAAAAIAICFTAGTLTGCGGKASAEKIIKIGVFEPTTGIYGSAGYQELLGIRYANQKYPTVRIGNEDYTVKLVEVDNKSDQAEAVKAAGQLVEQQVSVVLGSYDSNVSVAGGQVFADNGIPVIGASCTNPQVTADNDYYYRVCFSDPFQGTVMAGYAFQNNATTAAVITQTGDRYSSDLGSYFKETFTHLGGTIVNEQQFKAGQTDFRTLLSGVQAAAPDIIYAPSATATAPYIISQARELGITSIIATGDTWENASVIESAGADAEGVVLSTFFDETEPANDEAAAFIKGFKDYLRSQKQEETIPAVSALGYDAYLAAIKAIETAGATDPAAIRNALAGVQINGVTGTISFDETGDANKNLAFIRVIRDGRFQFLTTVTISN